jgi:hypothetical protein
MYFAKHETFHIREGWLFKGMNAIKTAEAEGQPATIFLDRDAPERLGIGRNMVRALRFWMQATGLAREEKEQSKIVQRLTSFGEWVWQHDRYLEDEGTLWLVHYRLVTQKDQASSWYWFFNHFSTTTFGYETCLQALNDWVISEVPDQKIAKSSLKKDVDILLRTYIPSERVTTPENLMESPLSRLGLLSNVGNRREPLYRREQTDPSRLPVLILLYVLIDQQQIKRPDTFQVSLGQVLREPMNVGQVFNLTTAVLADLLTTLNKQYPDLSIRFVRTAGLDELDLPTIESDQILARYARERAPVLEVA